jgi:hypothetical protein
MVIDQGKIWNKHNCCEVLIQKARAGEGEGEGLVEPLVKYFEAAAINVPLSQGPPQGTRCITADYQKFLSTYERLVEIMT